MTFNFTTLQGSMNQPCGDTFTLMFSIHKKQKNMTPVSHSHHANNFRVNFGNKDKTILSEPAC
ncbi:MAG: hypothetical protein AMS22_13420 [Thiotrichales bacterium SG8_50]|nr:MAG: hypothetical protein AMS22_13420 [Thiotrichales bacterium SG8_50]